MSTETQNFRSRSRTLPARVKIEQKIGQDTIPRPRSPMRRLADILKRKKKRGKGDADSFNKLPLEKQAWFHGKITADFAERYLRRDGHFLVREDPAKPGSCFIVVRHKRESIHVPLCKVNSSKGTRIKFRTEDSENSFDSIPELINYYVSEGKPLSPKTQAVITHAVSRDATLLSTDDFHNRYVFNASPSNGCPPKAPGTGPLRQKKLDKYTRKNSDPGLHFTVNNGSNVLSEKLNGVHVASGNVIGTVQSKQRQKIPGQFLEKASKEENISDRFYEAPFGENETNIEEEIAEDPYHYYEKPDLKVDSDNFYDKPTEPKNSTIRREEKREENCVLESEESFSVNPDQTQVGESFYNEPSLENYSQAMNDRPPSVGSQNSLGNQLNDSANQSPGDVYDKPRASTEGLYDSPKGSRDDLYDKPPPRPKRVVSFRKSDPTLSDKEVLPRPKLVSRSSAPSSPSCPGEGLLAVQSKIEDGVFPDKRHSGDNLTAAQIKGVSSEGVNNTSDKPTGAESKLRYSTPPKKPQRPSLSRSKSEQSPHSKQDFYDSPRSKSVSADDSAFKSEETATRLQPESPKPLDKKGIFLSVMKKIGEKLLTPFLETDCLTLARHITRVDLVLVWGEEPHRCSWSIEDGTGGAKGLEILTLPQGREKRSELLQRFANLSHWVATLVVAAGDLGTREKVLSKLIELADILSDKLGNLISFMAVMEGLALPQVTRLHHTWSCLHHRCCSTAILYHSTLKPLAGLLSSGAPSPFPGVCLPYIVPLVRYMEMTPDEILHDWAHSEVDLGLEVILAHLASGRALTQQLEEFRQEAISRLKTREYVVNALLFEYFQEKVNVGNVLGLGPDPSNRTTKLKTLLQWLSESAENST
ncbi:breast cancer anti-estrogen resistance protein 3 homolog isoform X2 [Porites lutea]|uniref:breast cancer anti-estrogen resistance protein 3 homolog isoform X2 n=1 Tax=Porites lutea TaxID=51062 RepID=UPI003CC5741D